MAMLTGASAAVSPLAQDTEMACDLTVQHSPD